LRKEKVPTSDIEVKKSLLGVVYPSMNNHLAEGLGQMIARARNLPKIFKQNEKNLRVAVWLQDLSK